MGEGPDPSIAPDPGVRDRGVWADEAGNPAHPLVAVIHGTMDRSSGMLKLSRQLDSHARVLRYDRRGYGRSAPHPSGLFDMDEQVADLVTLLAGRPAILVGHSYGGNVALATAARHRGGACSRAHVTRTIRSTSVDAPLALSGAPASTSTICPARISSRFTARSTANHTSSSVDP